MAKADIMSILYSKEKSPLEFNFDSLQAPSLLQFMNISDIQSLENIATSVRYAGNMKLKKAEIKKIMERRNFKFLATGTNRTAFTQLEYQPIIAKVALSVQGIRDTPDEEINQNYLKPFVPKLFERDPSGVIGCFERVQPIISRKEFESLAMDIFDMITSKIIGEYVVGDIGTQFFMNWGIRTGFGPVLLDYPYVYKLDGGKLYCTNKASMGSVELCGGLIDYDNGFNNLICTRCGRIYSPKELKQTDSTIKIIRQGDDVKMKVQVMRGNEIIRESKEETASIDFNPKQHRQPKAFRGETIISSSDFLDGGTVIIAKRSKDMTPKELNRFRQDQAKEQAKEQRTNDFHKKRELENQNAIDARAEINKTIEEMKNKNNGSKEVHVTLNIGEEFKVPMNVEIKNEHKYNPPIETVVVVEEEPTVKEEIVEASTVIPEGLVLADNDHERSDLGKSNDTLLNAFGLNESDFDEPTEKNAEESTDPIVDKYAKEYANYEVESNTEKIQRKQKLESY